MNNKGLNDNTLSDLPGIELDAEMAQRILDHGDRYSQQTADLARFIHTYKSEFRETLLKQGLLQVAHADMKGFDIAAVDGASAITSHGGGTLIAATAYKASINDEKQRGASEVILLPNSIDIESFATLLRVHLELSLLASDKLDEDRLIILDHSFWGVMQAVSRALASYKSQRSQVLQARQNPDTDVMQLAWKNLFESCLDVEGSFFQMMRNKRVISLSKKGVSQYFVRLLSKAATINDSRAFTLASALNDRALLRHVLLPGEYTRPESLYHIEQEESSIKSWKRSRFATSFEATDGPDPFKGREYVFDEYGLPRDDRQEIKGRRLFTTYYLPHEWSRVYRIEFHEPMLMQTDAPFDPTGQGKRFQRVLASVKQSVRPETKEPLCQVLADIRSKVAGASAVSTLPERTFYQLRDLYRNNSEMLDIVDTLIKEERT